MMENLEEPEDVLYAARGQTGALQEKVTNAYGWGSLCAGPAALGTLVAADNTMFNWDTKGSLAGGPGRRTTPVLSVTTQHTSANVYPALHPEQLAALVHAPDLPREVRETLARYANRPFALLALRLLPSEASTTDSFNGLRPSEPGVHFTFTQAMLPTARGDGYHYDFPLGTGPGWPQPVTNTQVFVTARDDLNLTVDFPKPVGAARDNASFGRPNFSDAGAVKGRQVHFATYGGPYGTSPARDITITLHPTGPSPLLAAQDSQLRRAKFSCVFFPLLGLGAWLASFRLLTRKLPWRKNSAWWAISGGWLLVPQILAAVPLVYFREDHNLRESLSLELHDSLVAHLFQGQWWQDRFAPTLPLLGYVAVLLALWAVLLCLISKGDKEHVTQMFWRAPVAMLLSAFLYLSLGSLALQVLTPFR